MKQIERVKGVEGDRADVYTFHGLQGAPRFLPDHKNKSYHSNSIHGQTDGTRHPDGNPHASHRNEAAAATGTGGLLGRYATQESNTGMLSLKVLAMAQTSRTGRTVFHDLVTPHRSYVFAARWKTPSAERHEQVQRNTRSQITPSSAADPRIEMRQRRQSELQRRQVQTRARSVAAACTPHFARTASTNSERQQHFKDVRMQHLMKGHSWDRKNEEPNDLVGAFQNPKLYSKPKVRTFSTFEEYLERTVNMERETPIQFHPSQVRPVHKSFRSRRESRDKSRSMSTQPLENMDFDEIAKQLGLKGERAATAMGFAPSREVVEMHRKRPPWLIDPAIFVRAYADTTAGAVKETATERGSRPCSRDGSRSPQVSRLPADLLAELNLSETIEDDDLHN